MYITGVQKPERFSALKGKKMLTFNENKYSSHSILTEDRRSDEGTVKRNDRTELQIMNLSPVLYCVTCISRLQSPETSLKN